MSQKPSVLEASYRVCAEKTRCAGSNFYYGFVSLPWFRRRSIYAVYALSRRWDDIVDHPDRSDERKRSLLDREENRLRRMLEGQYADPVYRAVGHSIEAFQIPREYFFDLLNGVRMDLDRKRYKTFSDLLTYCYRVASCPGLIVLEIFGYSDERARDLAEKMGYAMQLTNIVRDVVDDLERDRVYLPGEDLERFGLSPEDVLRGSSPGYAFRRVIRRQVLRACRFFRESRSLVSLLTPSSKSCPLILRNLYRRILQKVRDQNFDVVNTPVNLNRIEKIGILIDSLFFHPSSV